MTEEDYKQASSNPTQNPTQQITVSPRRGSQPILSAHEKTLVLQGLAIIRETLQTREVGDEGLEPGPSSSRETHVLEDGNAPCDALTVNDPQLQLLIEAWPTLSRQVQQQVMLFLES